MTLDEFLMHLKEKTELFEKENRDADRIEGEETDLELKDWFFTLEHYVRKR